MQSAPRVLFNLIYEITEERTGEMHFLHDVAGIDEEEYTRKRILSNLCDLMRFHELP